MPGVDKGKALVRAGKDNRVRVGSSYATHIVQFYSLEDVLAERLFCYIYDGLNKGETCVVIATPRTLIALNKGLRVAGVDLWEAMSKGQYLIYDADELLARFVHHSRFDTQKFCKTLDSVVSLANSRSRPVRVFGEMVAVTLQQQNYRAMLELEEEWTKMLRAHQFSLYCAYPEHLFDSRSNEARQALRRKVCDAHSSVVE